MSGRFASPGGYDELMGRWSAELAPLFLDFVGIKKNGAKFLDVGCGTGSLVRAIRAGDQEAVIAGIDPAQAFIDHCKNTLAGQGTIFETGSALALPYPDGEFDYTLSLLVLMFVPDVDKAAREMRRVTKPGGTVGACTWHAEGLRIDRLFFEEAYKLDVAARSTADRLRHNSREGQLSTLWKKIGLRNEDEAAIEITMAFQSFDDYWIPMTEGAGPARTYISRLNPHQREKLKANVRDRVLREQIDGPFSLPAKALAVRGTVPG